MTMVGNPQDLCPMQSLGKVLGSFMDFVLPHCTEPSSNAIAQSSSDPREENALQTQTRFEPTPLK